MKRTLWMVVAVVGVYACGNAAGNLMEDAGQMLQDAGNNMNGDAGAQPPTGRSITCDETYVNNYPQGGRIEYDYATVQVDDPFSVTVEWCRDPTNPAFGRCNYGGPQYTGSTVYVQCAWRQYNDEGEISAESGITTVRIFE